MIDQSDVRILKPVFLDPVKTDQNLSYTRSKMTRDKNDRNFLTQSESDAQQHINVSETHRGAGACPWRHKVPVLI